MFFCLLKFESFSAKLRIKLIRLGHSIPNRGPFAILLLSFTLPIPSTKKDGRAMKFAGTKGRIEESKKHERFSLFWPLASTSAGYKVGSGLLRKTDI